MVQTVTELTSDLSLKRWTVDDYHRMIAIGLLTPDDRVELLDGQIVKMMPQDPPHASTIDESTDYLKTLFAGKAKVRAQLPITLTPDSEPEPDIAIVKIDPQRYRDRHPAPADVFLLIEIADSTLKHDRTHKSKIYARAGILEYWVVDINQRQVIVFRTPQVDGYQSEQVLAANTQLAAIAFPDVLVNLRNLLL